MTKPDFEQIALSIVERVESHIGDGFDASPLDPVRESTIRQAVEALRQVWNARGAADIQAIIDEVEQLKRMAEPYLGSDDLHDLMKPAAPIFSITERAIKTLDR